MKIIYKTIRSSFYVLSLTALILSGNALLNSLPADASGCTFTVTNTNDSGAGSLRQAILNSNGAAGGSVICFSIGSGQQTIIPTSALPVLTKSATIDGTTQPGFNGSTNAPIIVINGAGAGVGSLGLRVTGAGSGSTIKGLVINGFGGDGIFIDTGSVTIVGNYIGTDSSGNNAVGNAGDGIGVFSGVSIATSNSITIGGTTAANRNVISGNGGNGVAITAQNGGTTSNNIVSGNYIGTDYAGSRGIANHGDGVLINNAVGAGTATGNTVGGTTGTTPGGACTGACNLISGNTANGVGIWHGGAASNTVEGNYIGIDVNGTSYVGNGNIGVESDSGPNNTIGGTTPSARNIISGNLGAGVFLDGSGATGNTVEGNYIGTDVTGNISMGNVKMGLSIGIAPDSLTSANNNTIGGSTGTSPGGSCTGACNLISGNNHNGIFITGSGSNSILGNYIGTNVSGTGNLKNAVDGVGVLDSPNNLIGNPGASNVISANSGNGVIIANNPSTGNRVQFNNIGTGSNGVSLGNAGAGVAVAGGINTAIVNNSINFNVGLGIDLGDNGVTLNSLPAISSGPNESQNFPNVFAANSSNGVTKIGGELNSVPNTSYELQFFDSNNCNAGVPNNYGQGQTYLGSSQVTTDQFGNTAFAFTLNSQVSGNTYISATATKIVGGLSAETSEFSLCRLVNVSRPALTNGATWFLKNDLTSGPADHTYGYGFPSYLLMCAWDPNQPGVKLPVIFSAGVWYMRASYTTGTADLTFSYGASNAKPVCGDWNGDGVDTVGVVNTNMTWSLRNTNSGGAPDIATFQYGALGSIPVVGDWTGSGTETIGTFNPSNNIWNLRNSNSSGTSDDSFSYGFTPGYPVVGDWNGDGVDKVGSVSAGGTWALRNSNSGGPADVVFQYGFPGVVPVVW